MNTLRIVLISFFAIFIAASSSAPSKVTTSSTPARPAEPAVANIAGNWLISVNTPQGVVDADMSVIQVGKDFHGDMVSRMGNIDYAGSLNGNSVTFSYDVSKLGAPAGSIFTYTGVLEAGARHGGAVFGGMGEGTWTAKRN